MNRTLEQINQAHSNILKTSLDLLNQKDLWKARAERLAYRYSACLDCAESQIKLADLQCFACYEKAQKDKDLTEKEVHA